MPRPVALLCLISVLGAVACTESRQQRLAESAERKLASGSPTEGAELLRKVVALNPESKTGVRALYKLGFVLETSLRDFEGAVFNYNEFIRLSQDRVGIYEVLKRVANIYNDQARDPSKGIAAFRKLLDLSPESLEADSFQYHIGQSYYRLNNFDQARIEHQTLISLYPKSQFASRARLEIGNTYYMEGKYDIAEEALKQVIRHHAQSEQALEAQFLIGQCLEHQGKLRQALQEYESVQGRYPSPQVLGMRIADVRKKLKQQR